MTGRSPPAMSIDEAAAMLRLLGNSARLRLVLRISEGEVSVADLESELKIRQPNLSQHLAELRDAGLVSSRRDGRSVHYTLAGASAEAVVECLAKAIGQASAPAQRSAAPIVQPGAGAAVFARIARRG
jgi:DNA-binding transcriptional ArsR family regulator